MSRLQKITIFISTLLLISGCNCKPPAVLSVIRDGDKNLTCKDIKNEMYQAEFYRDEAKKNRGISTGQALAPLCWYGSYAKADEAIHAAEKRIERLEGMYERKQCAIKSDEPPAVTAPARPVAPAPTYPGQPMRSNDPNLHIHVLPDGTQFMHSHPATGTHTHAPDGTIRNIR